MEQALRQILLVDDDQKICDLIKVFLKISKQVQNVHCVVAHDTTQAMFKIQNQEFDLVIIDKNLPGKSGLELISHLRKLLKFQKQKILLLSGSLDREDVLFAVENKVNDILVKPFTFAQLMEKLKENL